MGPCAALCNYDPVNGCEFTNLVQLLDWNLQFIYGDYCEYISSSVFVNAGGNVHVT